MNIITLQQPPRIVIGTGCAPQCALFLAERGVRRVLLVTSRSVAPLLQPVQIALQQAGLTTLAVPPINPEPTWAHFESVLAFAREQDCDGVLAVGGGSVMDVAKLIAALVGGHQATSEVFGINLLAGRALPLVCLPTTAGTGSEVSPIAVLLDEADELKKGVVSPHLIPDAAFIDPLLTLSVPPAVTAATGMDALTHCIEAFANRFAHPAVDTYALQGIRLIKTNLERAVHDGGDTEARANLMLGSLYGGLCLGPVNTGAVHALAYPLGGRYRVAHGVANAVLLPHVLRFNLPAALDRYAEVACAMKVPRQGSIESMAVRGLESITRLSKSCAVPQRLMELKVPHEAIPGMAKSAMQVQRLLKNNPRPVTEPDVVEIYEATY